jgi:hypothetical protein
LLGELGLMLRHQGRLQSARDTLQWNYDRARSAFGENAPLTLRAGYQLAQSMESTGEFEAARTLADTLLAASVDQADVRRDVLLISSMLATKRHDDARGLADAKEAVALSRRKSDPASLAEALSYLSNAQLSTGDVAGAIASGEEQLALRIKQYGPKHVYVASANATLSRAYRRAHDMDAAERHILAALEIDDAVLTPNDWRHSRHLNALMALRIEQRDYRTALDIAKKCLDIDRAAYGDEHVEVTNDLTAISALNLLLEDYGAALKPLDELIARTDGKPATGRADRSSPHFKHGVALAYTGKYDAGIAELQHALDETSKTDAAQKTDGYLRLAAVQLDHGDGTKALPTIDALDASIATAISKDDDDLSRAAILRTRAYLMLGRATDARDLLDQQISAHPNGFDDPIGNVEVPLLRADAAIALKDSTQAAASAAQGFSRLSVLRNPPSRLLRLADRLHRELDEKSK